MEFQRGIFNTNKDICDVQEMYFRTNISNVVYNSSVNFEQGDFFSTDTYFNSLSVSKIKKYTNISDVSLKIKLMGDFILRLFHLSDSLVEKEIFLKKYSNNNVFEICIPIEIWSSLDNGLIYFKIEAINSSKLYGFSYITNSQPINNVKLAIVITHFNRQKFLLSALDRIKNELLINAVYVNVHVIISDNSQNLNFKSTDRIHVYKNNNYGGSGGFSFGLLKAKDQGFTHCLFMDDDASTEIESIKRIYDFFKYSSIENAAIVGAMFYEDNKSIQYEAGAVLKDNLKPLNTNLDLRKVENIIKNQLEEYNMHYGGWWFFAFPILKNINMPFPFFVRGDDVAFCLSNKFTLINFNGICSWQEDFLIKNNVFLYYQYIRSMIILYYTSLWEINIFKFIKFIVFSLLSNGLTYRYDLMEVVLIAVEDILKTNNWDNNINMVYKISELSERVDGYNWVEVKSLCLDESDLNKILSFSFSRNNIDKYSLFNDIVNNFFYILRLFISIFTIFGLLIPSFLFRNKIYIQSVNFYKVKHAFLNKKILLVNGELKVMFLSMNKIRFIYIFSRFIMLLPIILLKNNYNKKKYNFFLKEYSTEKFWRNIFKKF